MTLVFDTETQREPRPGWVGYFRYSSDGLVHRSREGWRSRAAHTPAGVFPGLSYTDCGLMIVTDDTGCKFGEYLAQPAPITCVRCAGGAEDGKQRRYGLKEIAFAMMYGTSESQLRNRYGDLLHADAEYVFGGYGRSLYRRCQRLAKTLYARALEPR